MCFLLSQDANRKRSKEDVVKFMTEMHEEGGDDQSLVVDRTHHHRLSTYCSGGLLLYPLYGRK